MKKTNLALSAVLVMALAFALVALAACGQQEESSSSSSEESLEAAEAEVGFDPSKLSKDPFYVLLIGNDTRTGTDGIKEDAYADGNARSDTSMLVRVDPVNYQLTFVTVPRDTKDYLDGNPLKINERYRIGGAKLLEEGIETLTGVRPRYYIDTTFVGFADIVNKLGGLDIYVPLDMDMTEVISGGSRQFSAGQQVLDGAQALILARNRYVYDAYGNIEAYRQSTDRMIAITLVKTLLANASTASDTTKALYEYVDTDWDKEEAAYYAEDFAKHAGEVKYLTGTGPYLGDIDAETELWMTYREEGTWAEIMAAVNAGRDPNEVLAAPTLYN